MQARLIAALGYRMVAALGATLRWKTEGLEHFEVHLHAPGDARPPHLHGHVAAVESRRPVDLTY